MHFLPICVILAADNEKGRPLLRSAFIFCAVNHFVGRCAFGYQRGIAYRAFTLGAP